MKAVVLGGGGFIGCRLVERLDEEGHQVTAVDIRSPDSERIRWLKHGHFDQVDLREPDAAYAVIEDAEIVFHLAADMGGVGFFDAYDFMPALDNGLITTNVLKACTFWETPRLFYASSACAYPIEIQQTLGDAPKLSESLLDTDLGTPDHQYGREKRMGLRYCERAPFDARVGILHTVFGPGQEHEGERMKFPAAVATKAMHARTTKNLELWGNGAQMRSYLYIDHALDKIMAIAFSDDYEGPVNVGAEGAVSCFDVARMCCEIVGLPDTAINCSPEFGPTGVVSRDCDNTKFSDTYGFDTESDLEDEFAEFIDWLEGI